LIYYDLLLIIRNLVVYLFQSSFVSGNDLCWWIRHNMLAFWKGKIWTVAQIKGFTTLRCESMYV